MVAPKSTTTSMGTATVEEENEAGIGLTDGPGRGFASKNPKSLSDLRPCRKLPALPNPLVNNTYFALFYTRAKMQPFPTEAASPNRLHSHHPRSPAPDACPPREK